MGANEVLDSQRSMNSMQIFRDNLSNNTSLGGTRKRDRRRDRREREEKLVIEGLFREPSSDEEKSKSISRS